MSRSLRALLMVALVPAALTACGSSSNSAGGSPAPSAAASSPAAAAGTIGTAPVTVGGATVVALTDSRGFTLYYRTNDTPASVTCTGACAAVWPPVLLPSGTPTAGAGVTGTLATIDGGNGRQVVYNGHPLYLYAKDSGPGLTTGEGVGGVWHVATTSLPPSM